MMNNWETSIPKSDSTRVVMIGPFPTPLHGFAFANASMEAALGRMGVKTTRIDVAPGRGNTRFRRSRDFFFRLTRGLSVLMDFHGRSRRICYLGLSGGIRQAIDMIFVLLARSFGWRLILHHHSFAYITKYSALTSIIVKLAGKTALHFVLCDEMGRQLAARYNAASNLLTLSNLSFADISLTFANRTGPPRTLGFLSNITINKGFDHFIEIVDATAEAGIPVQGLVAGPWGDAASQDLFNSAKARGAPIEYLGPVYGEAKQSFYNRTDIFIFPTKYLNEAQPFVVLEALAAGVPVISTSRGCIPDLLSEHAGTLIDDGDIKRAVSIISATFADPRRFDEARFAARNGFERLKRQAELHWSAAANVFASGLSS